MARRAFVEQPSTTGWMKYINLSCLTVAVLLSSLCCKVEALENHCGGYFELDRTGSQIFYSPQYPSSYPEGSFCIWILTAPRDFRVTITFSFTGDRYNGNCADYVEIRDGGPNSAILGTYCDTHTNVQLTTTNIWLYIMLKSDQVAPTSPPYALTATVSATFNSTPLVPISNQVPACRSYQFECPNKMCISMSYRCDAYNDCGCLGGCDEDGCGSLSISLDSQIGISVAVGTVLFAFICFLAHLFEGKNAWMSNKMDAEIAKEMQKLDQRRRATRMYSKFIGPPGTGKSTMVLFDKSSNAANKTAKADRSPRFDSTLKITDCEA